jgi:hypothetical protein
MKLSEVKWGMVLFHTKLNLYRRMIGLKEHGSEIWICVSDPDPDPKEDLIWDPLNCRPLTETEVGYSRPSVSTEFNDNLPDVLDRAI